MHRYNGNANLESAFQNAPGEYVVGRERFELSSEDISAV